MDTIELWTRNGDAVREAIELGDLVHLDTASEELTDEFLLFAIESALLSSTLSNSGEQKAFVIQGIYFQYNGLFQCQVL